MSVTRIHSKRCQDYGLDFCVCDPETCELCGHVIHPLCNGGNCQDVKHSAPDAEIEP